MKNISIDYVRLHTHIVQLLEIKMRRRNNEFFPLFPIDLRFSRRFFTVASTNGSLAGNGAGFRSKRKWGFFPLIKIDNIDLSCYKQSKNASVAAHDALVA